MKKDSRLLNLQLFTFHLRHDVQFSSARLMDFSTHEYAPIVVSSGFELHSLLTPDIEIESQATCFVDVARASASPLVCNMRLICELVLT